MVQLPNFKIQSGSPLTVILVVLALVAGMLFYFSVIKPGQINEYELGPSLQIELNRLKEFRTLQLDFSVFDRIDFRNLKTFGEVPVKPVPGGKTDLFSQ